MSVSKLISAKAVSTLMLFVFVISLFSFNFQTSAQPNNPEPYQEHERLDLRTPTSKTYQTGLRTFRTELFTDKIHYGNPGNFLDVNNNLVLEKVGDYAYRNAANDFTFRLGEDVSKGVEYSGAKGYCSFRLDSIKDTELNNSPATINKNVITYKDIYPNADLEFTVSNTGIKTEIVAKDQSALKEEISFELIECNEGIFEEPTVSDDKDTVEILQEVVSERVEVKKEIKENKEELTPTKTEEVKREGIGRLLEDTREEPKVEEQKEEIKEVEVKTKKKLVLKPDYSKLGKIDGEVRIDPSIDDSKIALVQDAFVSTTTPNGNRFHGTVGDYLDTTILCDGGPCWFRRSQSLLQFNVNIPELSGAFITGANLKIHHYGSTGATDIAIEKITGSWSESSISYNPPATEGSYINGDYNVPVYNSNTNTLERTIPLNANLVQDWRDNPSVNYGLLIKPKTNLNSLGFVFCNKEVNVNNPSHPCNNQGTDPVLEVSYYVNQPPYTPNPINPINNSEFSGNCDESAVPVVGNCRGQISVSTTVSGVGDGDPTPGDIRDTIFSYTGANTFDSNPVGGSGNVSYTGNFSDGVTNWKARSFDNTNTPGNFSPEFRFTTDTTPPNIPSLNSLPEYTAGVGFDARFQVELDGSKVTDNVSLPEQISYYLEYSNTSNFSSNVFFKQWQPDNAHFEIGRAGSDGVQGNSDDIYDGNTYYFRIKAKDKLNNITKWSNVVRTTIDGTKPVINSYTSSETRFSPNNSTSLGIKDSTTFTLNYTEKNPKTAIIEIYTDVLRTNKVRTLSQSLNGKPETATLTFVWDGKSDAGGDLPDNAYVAYAKVIDIVDQETTSNQTTVIVDNSGANINFSSPMDDYWTNEDQLLIKGQATAPNIEGKQDTDLQSIDIRKIPSGVWENIKTYPIEETPSDLGIFQREVNLSLGKNEFELKTTDTVGNTESRNRKINRETTSPVITKVKPDNLTNNTKPSITFTVTDPDISGDGSQRSDLKYGINPNSTKIWLTYKTYNPDTNSFTDNTKVLIDNGVNIDPSLVEDLNCTPATGAITSNKNGVPASNIVDCVLKFKSNLQPDSVYTIHISTKDLAQNEVLKEDVSFTLDSHIYSQLLDPKNGSTYSTSSVLFKGKSSIDSELKITNEQLGRTKTFTLNDALNGKGKDLDTDPNQLIMSNFIINCEDYGDIDKRQDTKDEQICNWEVRVLQKHTDTNSPTSNKNILTLKDAAGNNINHTVVINVNIYAFNLEISSDLKYFSPNGDGNQDSIVFTHTAKNPIDPEAEPEIKNYELQITNSKKEVVKTFTGNGNLPLNSFWDGKICVNNNCEWVKDGEYFFILKVITADDAIKTTEPQKLIAKTALLNEVVITNPKDGYVTTNGVINVQGQAPKPQTVDGDVNPLRGKVYVDICVDTVGTSTSCDMTMTVETDENGFFSSLIVLPRTGAAQILHNLTAKARDGFGNSTKNSNTVQVIQDTIDPFKSVKITPALTGISTKEDYEKFLRGEISIDKLRTLILSAELTQNTEQLQYAFAEYTDLKQKPENAEFNFISTVNNIKEDNLKLNPYNLDSIKKNHNKPLGDRFIPEANCDATSCIWEQYLPSRPDFGGIYEVEFKAKKGDTIQSLYAGFKADGNIPAAPIILSVEKWDEKTKSWVNIDPYEGRFYTNGTRIRIRGAADPNVYLKTKINGKEQNEFKSSPLGIWEYEFNYTDNLSNLTGCKESREGKCVLADFDISLISYRKGDDGTITNTAPSSNNVLVTYDTIAPELTKVDRKTPDKTINGWVQTGMPVQFNIESNEKLKYADVVKDYDGFLRLLKNQTGNTWVGSINGDGPEGYFHTEIRLMDLAGNIGEFHSSKTYASLNDWRIFIDNTKPDPSSIDKTNWDKDSGIKADGKLPEIGRLNPEYVIRGDSVTIKGRVEKDQRVEVVVNKAITYESAVANTNCIAGPSPAKVTKDGLTVKNKNLCEFSYTFKFEDHGENDEFGVPINYYIFQVRSLDKAANYSEYSKQEIVYSDKVSPKNPDITNISSSSYNPIVDWNTDKTPITKDTEVTVSTVAERFADMSYTLSYQSSVDSGQLGEVENRVVLNSSDRKLDQNFKLETGNYKDGKKDEDRGGCVEMQNGKRVGVCNDGVYTLALKATDAPGNSSSIVEKKVERDTVNPEAPNVRIVPNDDAHKIDLDISGEAGTTVIINNGRSYNMGTSSSIYLNVLSHAGWRYNTKYTYTVVLKDRAGNVSRSVTVEHTTPPPPIRDTYKCEDGIEGKLAYPFTGEYPVTSDFKDVRFFEKGPDIHNGIDFGVPHGTEILASAKGEVVYAQPDSAGGLGVMVHHQELGVHTWYWHLKEIYVNLGDEVEPGMVVGISNNTGLSTGDHLHYEVKDNANIESINPWSWLKNCNFSGEDEGGAKYYEPVVKSEAEGLIEKYIKDNLADDTQMERRAGDGKLEYRKLGEVRDKLKDHLDLQNWCGVWKQDLGSVVQKNGGTAYDAAVILNPFDKKVYLVKNGIWDKYVSTKGPCGILGVPKNEETVAGVRGDSIADPNRAWTQEFRKKDFGDNHIYAYYRRDNSQFFAFFTVNTVASYYEAKHGTWSEYGFPTGDTYPGTDSEIDNKSYCKQWFEHGREIDLCEYSAEENDYEYEFYDDYVDIENTDFELNINEDHVGMDDLVKDFVDMMQRDFDEVTEPLRRDCWRFNFYCNGKKYGELIWNMGYYQFKYMSGVVVGAGRSVDDFFDTIWSLISDPKETISGFIDGIKEILNDPGMLLRLLGDEAHRIMQMSLGDRIYEIGLIIGGFVPDIIVGILTAGGSTSASVAKAIVKALEESSDLARKAIKFTKYIDKTLTFGKGKKAAVLKKIGDDKVGISGKDAMKFTEEMDNNDFKKFLEQVDDDKEKEALEDYRDDLITCGVRYSHNQNLLDKLIPKARARNLCDNWKKIVKDKLTKRPWDKLPIEEGNGKIIFKPKAGKGGVPELKPTKEGLKDEHGNLWKLDQLHKDHYDVNFPNGDHFGVYFDGKFKASDRIKEVPSKYIY